MPEAIFEVGISTIIKTFKEGRRMSGEVSAMKYTVLLDSGEKISVEGTDLRRKDGCIEVVSEVGAGRELLVAVFPQAAVRGIFVGEISAAVGPPPAEA